MGSDVPDATTIRCFCQHLVEDGLWDILLGEVNRQLEAKHIIIPVNAHDSTERDTLLLGDEAALYADAAYYSQAKRDKMDRLGINDQAQCKGYRGHALSDANRLRNNSIAVTCPGGERSFTTYKSRYGLARTRLMGLAKNLTLLGMTAIAHYIAKGSKFLTLYGIPSQITASGRHKL